MTLSFPDDIADVPAARRAELLELLTSIVQQYNPDIDVRRGTFRDLVLTPRSLLTAATEQAVVDALTATSLAEITADPDAADEDAVDRVLGNFRLTRRPAAKASGSVTLVVSRLAPSTVAAGSVFTIAGEEFVADATYMARTQEAQVLADTDVLIAATTGSNYAFTVGVVARTAGSDGNVRSGAAATPSRPPYAFVRAHAAADFTGGADAETNTELLARQAAGLAARAWSTRPSIEAAVRAEEDFDDLVALSVVGFGDPEMPRDKHGLFPVATGGRADLYAKTAPTYTTATVRKTATLVSVVGAVGTWQLGLSRDDAPGFYEAVSVRLPGDDPAAGFAVASDVRSADVTGDDTPDVVGEDEAAYSRYQAAVLQFADTTTNAAALTPGSSQQEYDVVVRQMPLVAELQDFWLDPERAPLGGDVLVKAPVPCFVSLAATLTVPEGVEVDEDEAADALSAAVNELGFVGRLSASLLDQRLHDLIPELVSVTGLNLSGRIRTPAGDSVVLTGTSALDVPDDPENMVTWRTVAFFLDAEDVALAIVVDS